MGKAGEFKFASGEFDVARGDVDLVWLHFLTSPGGGVAGVRHASVGTRENNVANGQKFARRKCERKIL